MHRIKRTTTRRLFLQRLLSVGAAGIMPWYQQAALGQTAYQGKLLVAINLLGGIDVTSFCDPKTNVPGEKEINHWARDKEPLQAGNIPYANFAENARFFDKYYKDMLIINGVDAQTNSHTVGFTNNWSGRSSVGYPSITSMMAAINAPELPIANLSFGGFNDTQGIIHSNRLGNINVLRDLIYGNELANSGGRSRIFRGDWNRIQQLHRNNAIGTNEENGLTEGNRLHRESFIASLDQPASLKVFGDLIPSSENFQPERSLYKQQSSLHQQIQIALLGFSAGVSISADLYEDGFDSHTENDRYQESLIANVEDAIDYLWTYAEELGLADRIVVLIGSDFGRTPYYNSGEGKDHWPIGSYIVMERNAGYTNQVIGETDDGHNAFAISPETLQRDDGSGIFIRPAHFHKAFRKYLGIADNAITQQFPFSSIEEIDFFSSAILTPSQ